MIGACRCPVSTFGRVDSPTCPVHNRLRRLPALLRVRDTLAGDASPLQKLDGDVIAAHEQLFLAMLREHRETCHLCHDRDDLWVTCRLGEVLRGAWFNTFRLSLQPTTWSTVESVRPFSIAGVS